MSINFNASSLDQINFDQQEVRFLSIDGNQIWLNHFEKHSYLVSSETDRETKSEFIGPNYGPNPNVSYAPLDPTPGFQFIYDSDGSRYEIRLIHGSVYSSQSSEFKDEGKLSSGHQFYIDQLIFVDNGEDSIQTTIESMEGSVICLAEPIGSSQCFDLNNLKKNFYIDFPVGVDEDIDGVDSSIDINDNDPLIGRYAYVTIEPTTIDGYETINDELTTSKGFLPNMLVKIQANPKEEKEFDSWITNDLTLLPDEARSPYLEFPMPPRHVQITPSYVDVGGRQRRFLLDSSEQDVERGTVQDLKFGSYLPNEEVVVVATPKNGYKFTKWESEGANVYEDSTPETKLLMPKSDVKLKAVFDPKDYTINVKKPTGGKTTILPIANEDPIVIDDPVEQVTPVLRPFKTIIEVVAEPKDQKTAFKEWSVSGVDITEEEKKEPTLSFPIPSNKVEIAAVFETNEYTVQIDTNLSKNGIGYIGSIPTERSSIQIAGNNVIVNSNPIDGTYRFVGWHSDEVNFVNSSAESTSFVMPRSNVYIRFEYEKITSFLNLSVNDSALGSALGGGRFEAGDNVELKAYPRAGYEISEWKILTSGVSIPELSSSGRIVNFLMPSSDVNIQAFFEEAKYELNVIYDETITGMTVSGGGLKKYDEDVTVTVNNVPTSYAFIKWIYTLAGLDPIEFTSSTFYPSISIDMPPQDVTLELVLDAPSFEITAPNLVGGTINGLGSYKPLSSVRLYVEPSPGYDYVEDSWVFISGLSQSDVTKSGAKKDTIEFTMPESDIEILVGFGAKPFSVFFEETSGSNISYTSTYNPNPAKTNDSVSFVITPAEGYEVVDGSLSSGDVTFTSSSVMTGEFVMPANDVDINFELTGQTLPVDFGLDLTSGSAAGTVKGPSSAKVGDMVTLIAEANTGFKFIRWEITGCLSLTSSQLSSKSISFIMPGCDFTIRAVFEAPEFEISTSGENLNFEIYNGTDLLSPRSTEVIDSTNTKSTYSIKYGTYIKIISNAADGYEIDPATWNIPGVYDSKIKFSTNLQKDDTIEFFIPPSNCDITAGAVVEVFTIYAEGYSNNFDSHPYYNDDLSVSVYWNGIGDKQAKTAQSPKFGTGPSSPGNYLYNFVGFNTDRFSGITSSEYTITKGKFQNSEYEYLNIDSMPENDVVIAGEFQVNHCLHEVSDYFRQNKPIHYGLLSEGLAPFSFLWAEFNGRQYSENKEATPSASSLTLDFPPFHAHGNYVTSFHEDFDFEYSVSDISVAEINQSNDGLILHQPGVVNLTMSLDQQYLSGGAFSNKSKHYSKAFQNLDLNIYDDSYFGLFDIHKESRLLYSRRSYDYAPKFFLKQNKYSGNLDDTDYYNWNSSEFAMRFEKEASVSYSNLNPDWRAYADNRINAAQFGCSDSGHVFFNSTSVSKSMAYNTKHQSYSYSRAIQDARDVPFGAIAVKVFRKNSQEKYEQLERDIIFEIDPTDPYYGGNYPNFETYAQKTFHNALVQISGDGNSIVITHLNHKQSERYFTETTRVYRYNSSSTDNISGRKGAWEQVGEDIRPPVYSAMNVGINFDGNTIGIQTTRELVIYDFNSSSNDFKQRQTIKFSDLPNYTRDNKFAKWVQTYSNGLSEAYLSSLENYCNKLEFSSDGNTVALGFSNLIQAGGAVYVLNCSGSSWSMKGSRITSEEASAPKGTTSDGYFDTSVTSLAYDSFGHSLSLSRDGNSIAIGAPKISLTAYVLDGSVTATDQQIAQLTNNQITSINKVHASYRYDTMYNIPHIFRPVEFYEYFSVDVDYLIKDVATPFFPDTDASNVVNAKEFLAKDGPGYVKVYEYSGSDWQQKGEAITGEKEGDLFGYSVSMNNDSDIITVGAPLAYRYQKDYAIPFNAPLQEYVVSGAGYIYHLDSSDNNWRLSDVPRICSSSSLSKNLTEHVSKGKNGMIHGNRGWQDYIPKDAKHSTSRWIWLQNAPTHLGQTAATSNHSLLTYQDTSGSNPRSLKTELLDHYFRGLEEKDSQKVKDAIRMFLEFSYQNDMDEAHGHLFVENVSKRSLGYQRVEFDCPRRVSVGDSFDIIPTALNNANGSTISDSRIFARVALSSDCEASIDIKNSSGTVIKTLSHIDIKDKKNNISEMSQDDYKEMMSSLGISGNSNYSNLERGPSIIYLESGAYLTINTEGEGELFISVFAGKNLTNEFGPTIERSTHRQISVNSEGLKNELSWSQTFPSPSSLTDTISLSAMSTSGTVNFYASTSISSYTRIIQTEISEKINTLDIGDIYADYAFGVNDGRGTSVKINFAGLKIDGNQISFNSEGSYNLFAVSPSTNIYSKSEIIHKTVYVTDGVARYGIKLKRSDNNVQDLEILSPTPTEFNNNGEPLFKSYEKITVKAIPREGRIITGFNYIDTGEYTYNQYTFDKENPYFEGRVISADTIEIEIKPIGSSVELWPVFIGVKAPDLSWVQDIGETIMIGQSLDLDLRNSTTGKIFGPYGLTIESSDTDILSVTNKTSWSSRTRSYDYDRKIVAVSEGTVTISAYEDNFPDYKIEKTIEVIPFTRKDIEPTGDHKILIRQIFSYSDPCTSKTRYTEIDHIPFIPWVVNGDPAPYISNIQLKEGQEWGGRYFLFGDELKIHEPEIAVYSSNVYPPIYFYNDQSQSANALEGVTKISAGTNHSLFLQSGGESWGSGNGQTNQYAGTPYRNSLHYPREAVRHVSVSTSWYFEEDFLQGIVDINGGYKHSFLIKDDGGVLGAGYNDKGQLGIGKKSWPGFGELLDVLIDDVKSASGGYYHSLFLKNDGTVWACGDNTYGQLGDGTNIEKTTPIQVMSDVSAISAGALYSLFLKNDGSVWGVGQNNSGQLGDGTFDDRNTPIQIINSGITQISANSSGAHCLFLKQDGTVLSTGSNDKGQLANGVATTGNLNTLMPVLDSNDEVFDSIQSVSAGSNYSMFLKNDGNAWGVGYNTGKIGVHSDIYSVLTSPTQTVFSNVAEISAGSTHTLFLLNDQTVYAVGDGYPSPDSGGYQVSTNESGKNAVYLSYPGMTYDKQGLDNRLTISDELKNKYYTNGSFEALPPSTDSCDEHVSDLINTGITGSSQDYAEIAPIYISPNKLQWTSQDIQYYEAKRFYDNPPASVSGYMSISERDLINAVNKPMGSYNVQKKYILGLSAKVNNSSANWSEGLISDGKPNYFIPEGLIVSGMDYMIQEKDQKIFIVFSPGETISLNWPTTSKVGSPENSTIYNFSHWAVQAAYSNSIFVDGMPYKPEEQQNYVNSILSGGANNSDLEITLPDYMESARVTITAHFVS